MAIRIASCFNRRPNDETERALSQAPDLGVATSNRRVVDCGFGAHSSKEL